MNSKITIEIDFQNNNEPIIQILSRNSDDIRDKLIKSFLQKLGGESSWLKIHCEQITTQEEGHADKFQRWHISPIQAKDFEAEYKAMKEQLKLLQEFEEAANR